MEITLTPELEKIVEELVRTGPYESASDVVIDALRQVWVNPEIYSPALEEMLIEGMEGRYEPLTRETLDQIRRAALHDMEIENRGKPPDKTRIKIPLARWSGKR